ncbi:MAG: EamA family transporter [Chloroflexota bacterium]
MKVQSPLLTAVLWMIGALFSFMMMGIGGRELSSELGTFQILFFRSIIGLVVVSILLSTTNWQQVKTKHLKTHIWRNVAHYGGQFGWFYGISILPLAEVFALEFTLPIWVTFLAPLFLGERFTKARLTAVIVGFIGVLIILRPGLAVINPASFIVLGAALGFAISTLFTKKLSATESPINIIFYMTIIQLPLGFVPALANWVTPSLSLWPWLIVVGVGALSAHHSTAKALTIN